MNTNNQSNQAVSVLNNFDFTAIEDLDPSLGKFEIVPLGITNFAFV